MFETSTVVALAEVSQSNITYSECANRLIIAFGPLISSRAADTVAFWGQSSFPRGDFLRLLAAIQIQLNRSA
jgi:hypothetical protein